MTASMDRPPTAWPDILDDLRKTCANCGATLNVIRGVGSAAVRCPRCRAGGDAVPILQDGEVVRIAAAGPALVGGKSMLLSDGEEPVIPLLDICSGCGEHRELNPDDERCVACRDGDGLVRPAPEPGPMPPLVADGGCPDA